MALTIEQATALAIAVAPELAGGKLEIFHRPDWPGPPNCYAWAGLSRDGRVKEALIASGRWRGEFPSVVNFVQSPTVETLLHELAHVVPVQPALPDVELRPSQKAFEANLLQLWVAGELTADRPPWTRHAADWIRRCIHLWVRATTLGVPVRQCNIGACIEFDNGLDEYSARLGQAELQRFARATFAEIEATPAPEHFLTLFRDDQSAWLARYGAPHD